MSADMNDERAQQIRILEALLFAAEEPLDDASLKARLPEDAPLGALLEELRALYAGRGVNLVGTAGRWAFRTSADLAPFLRSERTVRRKLSRAAVETLAIVAYHQPVTRAEIEEMRGVSVSRGTLDTLLEAGWVRPGRRRQSPGKPVTWITTDGFLEHFGLGSRDDLPGVEELKASGLLDKRPAISAVGALGGEDEVDRPEEEDPDTEAFAEGLPE
ncbi:MAG: SMC-Scp complex subunit ScpB [Rhodospirillaceae bacterium]|jgi:segregation and condensation protein B|nr:SMC-Scp complex subunit ScpB [Rhodospirillaceae bacterium]